jgi:hypothetical protein
LKTNSLEGVDKTTSEVRDPDTPPTPTWTSPPIEVRVPVKVLSPVRYRLKLPDFVTFPNSAMEPPKVVMDVSASVRFAPPRSTVPEPVMPEKVASCPSRSRMEPAARLTDVGEGKALSTPSLMVPELMTTPPVFVLAEESTSVPVPFIVIVPFPDRGTVKVSTPDGEAVSPPRAGT